MISKRNYFTTLLLFLILAILFMGTELLRERWNDYDQNRFRTDTGLTQDDQWQMDEEHGIADITADDLIFIGRNDAVKQTVQEWATYAKRKLFLSPSLSRLPKTLSAGILVVDGTLIQEDSQVELLSDALSRGCHVIFAKLPSYSTITASPKLQALLGIAEVRGEKLPIEGMHLYSGFLLGGEVFYEALTEEEEKRNDLPTELPWYVTLKNTKTYMNALVSEDVMPSSAYEFSGSNARDEYLPAVIWRNSINTQRVFCVNGKFMEDRQIGMGLLSAMTSDLTDYALYPIINAQNLSLLNFPPVSDENDHALQALYGRSQTDFARDVMFPQMSALVHRNNWALTAFYQTKLDYTSSAEPKSELWEDYLKELSVLNSEMGISMVHNDTVSLAGKLLSDEAYYQRLNTDYAVSAASYDRTDQQALGELLASPTLSGIRTLTAAYDPKEPLFSYFTKNVTLQQMTSSVETHTFVEDLELRGIETALGYSNPYIDFHKALPPTKPEEEWQTMVERIAGNLETYWRAYAAFDQTTLSESDAKLRHFLSLDAASQRDGDTIALTISTFRTEASFLLRLHQEIVSETTGCTAERIEDGVWLIRVTEPEAQLRVQPSAELKYREE